MVIATLSVLLLLCYKDELEKTVEKLIVDDDDTGGRGIDFSTPVRLIIVF